MCVCDVWIANTSDLVLFLFHDREEPDSEFSAEVNTFNKTDFMQITPALLNIHHYYLS